MERLTKPLIVPETGEVLAYKLNPGVTDTKARTKLGKYEDIEDQCIKENAFGIRLLLEKWREFLEDIHELAEYRKLKKQGKLQILPCVVGDTVYVIMVVGVELGTLKYQVFEAKVIRYHIDSFHLCVEMITENGQRIELVAETFGETVFPSREEAEAALEKMKGEEHGEVLE